MHQHQRRPEGRVAAGEQRGGWGVAAAAGGAAAEGCLRLCRPQKPWRLPGERGGRCPLPPASEEAEHLGASSRLPPSERGPQCRYWPPRMVTLPGLQPRGQPAPRRSAEGPPGCMRESSWKGPEGASPAAVALCLQGGGVPLQHLQAHAAAGAEEAPRCGRAGAAARCSAGSTLPPVARADLWRWRDLGLVGAASLGAVPSGEEADIGHRHTAPTGREWLRGSGCAISAIAGQRTRPKCALRDGRWTDGLQLASANQEGVVQARRAGHARSSFPVDCDRAARGQRLDALVGMRPVASVLPGFPSKTVFGLKRLARPRAGDQQNVYSIVIRLCGSKARLQSATRNPAPHHGCCSIPVSSSPPQLPQLPSSQRQSPTRLGNIHHGG
jgi:hypothetical protein